MNTTLSPTRRRRRALVAGLALALATLGACSSSTPSTAGSTQSPGTAASPAPAADAKVTVVSDPSTIGAFMPASVTIKVGQTVQWTFQDTNPHTVTANDASFTSAPGGLTGNATYSHTFTTAGTVGYHCAIHPQMKATVVVQ